MTLETEYRGYKITYNDNSDTWSCWKLKLEHSSLAKMKEMIGKIEADSRRIDLVPVLILDGISDAGYSEGKAVMLDDDGKSVWVMVLRRKSEYGYARTLEIVERREKRTIDSILADTPENREILDQIVARGREISDERNAMAAKVKALARFTPPPAMGVAEKEPVKKGRRR